MTCEMPPGAAADVLFSSVRDVFTAMLGTELSLAGPAENAEHPFDGILAFVGVTGKWIGTGRLWCSNRVAIDMASRFMMSSYDCVNDEVLDAIGEITNMVIGGLKNWLEEWVGALQMSTPTVVSGTHVSTRTLRNDLVIAVRCVYPAGELAVKMCMMNATGSSPTGSL